MNKELEMNPNKLVAFLGKPSKEFTKADIIRFIKEVTIYSLDVLRFLFGTSLLFHVQF